VLPRAPFPERSAMGSTLWVLRRRAEDGDFLPNAGCD
jgi:hypothetical protein